MTTEAQHIPSLGQRLAWIWGICGLGLLLMGVSSSWDEAAFSAPQAEQLHSFTGELQSLQYSAPAKSPTLVDMVIYDKHDGFHRGYLRYGLHTWEERLKPYMHQHVTLFLTANKQVWGVEVHGQMILTMLEIEQRLQAMKLAQQAFAEKMMLMGLAMVVFWLLFLRQPRKIGES